MAVISALQVNPGFHAKIYYHYEPTGRYWELVKPHAELIRVEVPTQVFGNPVEHYAHRADVLRLQILFREGGIYLDLDTICQNPFKPLLDGRVVMGREAIARLNGSRAVIGLGNAMIIAPPAAIFIGLWYNSYRDFVGGPAGSTWNKFSVQVPMSLAQQRPDLLRIEPASSFFWPSWDSSGIDAMFRKDLEFPGAYSFHLWESNSWELIKDLDVDRVLTVDTTYNRIARRFIP